MSSEPGAGQYGKREGAPPKAEGKIAKIKVGEIFIGIFDRLLNEPSEYQLRQFIGTFVVHAGLKDAVEENIRYEISQGDVRKLRFHFEALGLIQAIGAVEKIMDISNEYIAWAITEKGRRYVAQSNAILRRAPISS